jgi:DNA-binding GntR family transcriptional regulator
MASNLSKMAYDEILKKIVAGEYRQGQLLTEDKLCKELNMSRTPVREALRVLESEGVIKKVNRSYTVIYVTAKEVEFLYEVRIPLEITASGLAAERATEQDIQEMERVLRDVEGETFKENPDPAKLAELNGYFHDILARASGNPFLQSYLREVRLKLRIVRVTLFTSFDRRLDELREHKEIFNAVKARDSSRAREDMAEHERNVLEYLRNRVFPILLQRS